MPWRKYGISNFYTFTHTLILSVWVYAIADMCNLGKLVSTNFVYAEIVDNKKIPASMTCGEELKLTILELTHNLELEWKKLQ